MKDTEKTKEQLIEELAVLWQRVGELETSEVGRKQAEEALREREEHYRKIFDYSHDGIFVIDPERDEILEANHAACGMLEYTREELLVLSISTIHPKEMDQLQTFAGSVLEEGKAWTDKLTCTTKSGQVLPVEISASHILK